MGSAARFTLAVWMWPESDLCQIKSDVQAPTLRKTDSKQTVMSLKVCLIPNRQNKLNLSCAVILFFFLFPKFCIGEVARLFEPYARTQSASRRRSAPPSGPTRAPPSGPPMLSSYTHNFCCLQKRNASVAPSRVEKDHLGSMGLGEKRLTFRGKQ